MKRLLILLGVVAIGMVLWNKRGGETLLTGRAMGCDWKLLSEGKVERAEVAAVIERWEQVLSTWREDSDLSRFNRGEPATADLSRVLRLAEQLRTETGGAFDHRMLAQLTTAGFGPGGSGVDLSSIGKGFAVDRVAERLRELGVRCYVFSIAGEVRAGEGKWPVAIEKPEILSHDIAETIDLSGQAMATSGNYRQWNRKDGEKLASHILNPATGQPVMRPPCSVTVIGPDAALASGWATALFVSGPQGAAAAELRGLRVIWHGDSGARD